MELGAFSISLAVRDIAVSRAFYEKLGFAVFGGDQEQRWLIMKSGTTLIGLFQGWDSDAKPVPGFVDVRRIQERLTAAGLTLNEQADAATTGPAYITLTDPDGNPILIDQHV